MRRRTIALAALAVLAGALGLAAAGCGGEQTVTPTPSTVQGTVSSTTTTTATTPQGPKGDPVAGKAVFTGSAGCTGCHTLKDSGSTGTVGPNLDDAKPNDALVVDRVTNGKGVMPSFKGTLSQQQIADVAAYVSSVAGQ